tara:strand:+ start:298 stop:1200 length:903 start_codon:yes stop_codon:yes gene_type:complete
MKTALVCGAGGFIGSHLVRRLKADGYWVRGVDVKLPSFSETAADDFAVGDLCNFRNAERVMSLPNREVFDEVYQLASDMGGADYIYSGENDSSIIHNSAQINLNVGSIAVGKKISKLFYASSAIAKQPDSEYCREKLFSERFYSVLHKNHGLDVRIARYHNIFGLESMWDGGREKVTAALCRKIINATEGSTIDVWGTGKQTRSFLYIDDCIEGSLKLMQSNCVEPVDIAGETITINQLAEMIIEISGKNLKIKNIDGPVGSDSKSINELSKDLHWQPSTTLVNGLYKTYKWIEEQNAKQ